jgi:hypothetical protein
MWFIHFGRDNFKCSQTCRTVGKPILGSDQWVHWSYSETDASSAAVTKFGKVRTFFSLLSNMLCTVLSRVRASLNDLSITENQEQIGKKKEAEFLSKKINEYAANIRHFEVFKKVYKCNFLKI